MATRVTNREDFVLRAVKKHGPKYDYSMVMYLRSDTKVDIVCPEHGIFSQIPNSHLNGRGCPECGKQKQLESLRITVDEFLERAKKVHGDKYRYTDLNYVDLDTEIRIVCPKHGVFGQRPQKHLRGHGCRRCAKELPHYLQMTTESFIEKAKKIYGDQFDYSLVDYKKSCAKVKVVCREHGIYEVTPNNHLKKMGGCPACAEISRADKRRSNTQEFIDKAKRVHGDRYDYSCTKYTDANTKVNIKCSYHGIFVQMPTSHTDST